MACVSAFYEKKLMFNRDTNEACVTKNSLILLQNMRSLPRNFDEFDVYLNTTELKPDLICITETWLSEQNSCEIFKLDGYHPLLVASRKKTRGRRRSLCERNLLLLSGKETNNKQSADH